MLSLQEFQDRLIADLVFPSLQMFSYRMYGGFEPEELPGAVHLHLLKRSDRKFLFWGLASAEECRARVTASQVCVHRELFGFGSEGL